LCFADSKVSLFFPPHAVLVSILLVVPTRHWWAYTLAAVGGHFWATQQAHWPLLYSLQCEAFDAAQNLLVAGGIRTFIKTPLKSITLRDAIVFVLIAGVIVPFGTAFWGAAFTISHHFGAHYWVEWRNLGVSNAVTAIVLLPAILLGFHQISHGRLKATRARLLEGAFLGAGILIVGSFVFHHQPAGPDTSPALLYAPIPLLVWAALRFGLGGTSISILLITFQAMWGTMQGRGPFLLEAPAENALALQMFLLVTATPLLFLAVAIEDERRSKGASLESAELMGLAADAANIGMWVWDVSGDDAWMTEQGRALFGLKPDARIDFAALIEHVHPDDREIRKAAIKQALQTQGGYELEYRVQSPDGEVRWISARGRCMGMATGVKLLGVSMDVTARKQAELDASHQRAELSHLSRVALVGEMAASLAHELNQPLTAMVTNASAAQRFIARDDMDRAELREMLDDIAADGRRAGEVIRGIRGMVRKVESDRRTLDVNEIIAGVLRLVRADALAHGCTLTTELDSPLPRIFGDPVQLQQVLLNLIINAFDAMRKTPGAPCRVEIASRRADANSVKVSVRDFGPGLPADGSRRLFERFFSTKTEGMGMGLAIARSIIEGHAGTLDAENADGGGARFWFCIPAEIATAAKAAA
ncbi:MAG TPA: MASE1 domain-containing protein, partial [Chthoniobacteraceae bacterium]|nr:MASE1 domain-containing protein [Chthoniobacteraceae bacterium]